MSLHAVVTSLRCCRYYDDDYVVADIITLMATPLILLMDIRHITTVTRASDVTLLLRRCYYADEDG